MKEDETQHSNTVSQLLLHNESVFGLTGPRSELHGVVGDQLIGWKSIDRDADLPGPKPDTL